ncbi:MAG: TIGR03667 family PPOX class F420-dependent oxidoreductase [Acidimicrobiia bacterium]|nr:TIGR03667 family PPOX class F420-dependent oxidoreductase [Acidimicrobiia bacterium]
MFADRPQTQERLERELIIWLTTVRPNGQPQTSAVWFIVDDGEFLIYSKPSVAKVDNIAANPKVALNLDGNGMGGDIVTVEGSARIVPGHVPADQMPKFVAKYADRISRNGWTPASFAADYSVPIRVNVTRARAW